ncbi:MAG: metal-sulfur cluster assembly factor [Gaiellaceae bacterium]
MSDALVARVRAAVNEIPDPCSVSQGIPTGLVDMGLLCDIELGPDDNGRHDVLVRLRLTGPGCFYGIHFEREIRQRLEAMADVAEIDVDFSREFDWTQDDIAPHIQEQLRERRERLIATLPVRPGVPAS